ncbi:MAG TPA: SGNH/GDSL hydrolase family protein [Pyrinomonadaceae bacterium]|nr:SGNH/GDSL hydrolase family protein [Pyrinomonadaceae bacterium]
MRFHWWKMKDRVVARTIVAAFLLILVTACSRRAQEGTITGTTQMKTGPIVYVALGDSTGTGVGAVDGGYVNRLFKRLLEQRPGSQLANLCVSGAATGDVLRGQLDNGVSKNPDLVTLGIGINDLGHGISLEQFAQNYDRILSTLKEKTDAQIVVSNLPDVSGAPMVPSSMRNQYHQKIVTFNQKLEEVAKRHGVTVFDIYSVTTRELPSHPEYFSRDGFHPSDEGYELWAVEMWPTVARAIGAT